jgi:hypothetical protein
MTRKSTVRLLWLVTLATLPVPFYLGQLETAPVLRLAFLTGLLTSVVVAEGGTTIASVAGLGVAQTLGYAVLLRFAARLLARALDLLPTSHVRRVAVACLAIALCVASLFPIYETPLSSTRLRSSVWQLFD